MKKSGEGKSDAERDRRSMEERLPSLEENEYDGGVSFSAMTDVSVFCACSSVPSIGGCTNHSSNFVIDRFSLLT